MSTKWNRILATTDASKHAGKAVEYAHGIAEQVGAELHVLHVVNDVTRMAIEYGATGVLEPGERSGEYDRWLSSILGESGKVRRVEAVRVGDDVAETVARYAASNEIDVIVTASHGRTGLAHLLLGSVAEEILREAPCPVLVIRPEREPE